jgi:hypothetical protein
MAWSVLQSASTAATSTNATTQPVTYGTNLSSGTKLIAYVSISSGSTVTTSSVSDGTNNFNSVQSIESGSQTNISVWQLDTPAGDVGTKPTITAHLSGTAECSILIQEVSGLATGTTNAACVDGTPGTGTGSGGSSTGSPSYSSSASNEFLVAVYGDNGGPETWTKPAALTADTHSVNTNSFSDLAAAYGNSTNGTEAGSWSLTGSTATWGTILLAFKLGAAAPTTATQWPAAAPVPPGFSNPMAWQNQEPTWLTPEPIPAAQTPVETDYPTPPGFMSPMAWQDQAPTYNPPPAPTPITLADAAAAVDAQSPIAAAVPLADAAAALDVASGLAFPLADAAASVDSISVAVAVPLTDVAGITESIVSGVPVTLTDAAAAVDAITVPAEAITLADAAGSVDSLTVAVSLSVADVAAAVDAETVAAAVPLADAAAAIDSITIPAEAITLADAAAVVDVASALAFPLTDAAGVVDAFALTGITLSPADAAGAIDAIVVGVYSPPPPPWTPPSVTPGRVLWGTGILLTAPSGTAVPSDQNLGVASAWLALGWTYVGATVDGVQISYAPSVTELASAEGTPLAEVVTAADVTVSVALSEETLATIALATGNNAGVAVTAAGAGQPGKQVLSLSTTWPTMAAALIGLNQLGYARVLLVPSVVSTGQMAVPYRRAAAQRAYPVTLTATCPWTSITWTDLTSVATS